MHKGRQGDERYYYWEHSDIAQLQIATVPIRFALEVAEDGKKTYPMYTAQGLRNFYPWYVSEKNSSSNDDYLDIVMSLLEKIEAPGEKSPPYSYIRGDVNIFMPWLRVPLFLIIRLMFE